LPLGEALASFLFSALSQLALVSFFEEAAFFLLDCLDCASAPGALSPFSWLFTCS
jgi:hypothetical protein